MDIILGAPLAMTTTTPAYTQTPQDGQDFSPWICTLLAPTVLTRQKSPGRIGKPIYMPPSRWRGAFLMISSTLMIISAASAAEQSCDILLLKDSIPGRIGKPIY